MIDTINAIRQWAIGRNLINGATPAAQYQKLLEEVGELGRALIEAGDEGLFTSFADTVDAIGDCVVVLTILAEQNGTTIEQCAEVAYQSIKDRKGKMVNGIFVKDAE